MALDPLNRRATRRTFIFACFEGRAAGGYAEGERIRDARTVKGAGGREGGREDRGEGPATMRHMARARPRLTRDAVQLPAASSIGSRTKPPRTERYRVAPPLRPLPVSVFPFLARCSVSLENVPLPRFLLPSASSLSPSSVL